MEKTLGQVYLKIVPNVVTIEEAQEHNKIGDYLSKHLTNGSYKPIIPGEFSDKNMEDFLVCIKDEDDKVVLKMVDLSSNQYNTNEFISVSKDEFNKQYISLEEFLNKSKFLGQWGEILDPETNYTTCITDDRANEELPLVLYSGETHNIVLQKEDPRNVYVVDIIDKSYYDTWKYSDITEEDYKRNPGLNEFLKYYSCPENFYNELTARANNYVNFNSQKINETNQKKV